MGRAAVPRVLDDGRLAVLAISITDDPEQDRWNALRPWLVYSDNADADTQPNWFPTVAPVLVGDQAVPAIVAPNTSQLLGSSDTNFPSLAVYHTPEPDHLFVAFAAERADRPGDVDIFVSRGQRNAAGGIDFPSAPENDEDPLDLLHLTDEMLDPLATPGDQYMPAIAVDQCGVVHLLFYNTAGLQFGYLNATYVRIAGFGTSQPSLFVATLTPQPFVYASGTLIDALGEYIGIDAVGSLVVPVYAARVWLVAPEHPQGGYWSESNYYYHRITQITCTADFNGDGAVTSEDMDLYTAAHTARDGSADVNEDGSVDAPDLALFTNWYAAGR